jgi:hypothetical protein
MRGYMTICHTFADNAYAELTGPDIKFWAGQGLADYEGAIDGFEEYYPERFEILRKARLIKSADDPAPM